MCSTKVSTRNRQSTRLHRHFIACLIFDYSFVTVPLIFLLKVFFLLFKVKKVEISDDMSSSESYAKSGGFNDIDESDAILTQEEERLHAAARQPSGKFLLSKSKIIISCQKHVARRSYNCYRARLDMRL